MGSNCSTSIRIASSGLAVSLMKGCDVDLLEISFCSAFVSSVHTLFCRLLSETGSLKFFWKIPVTDLVEWIVQNFGRVRQSNTATYLKTTFSGDGKGCFSCKCNINKIISERATKIFKEWDPPGLAPLLWDGKSWIRSLCFGLTSRDRSPFS